MTERWSVSVWVLPRPLARSDGRGGHWCSDNPCYRTAPGNIKVGKVSAALNNHPHCVTRETRRSWWVIENNVLSVLPCGEHSVDE